MIQITAGMAIHGVILFAIGLILLKDFVDYQVQKDLNKHFWTDGVLNLLRILACIFLMGVGTGSVVLYFSQVR